MQQPTYSLYAHLSKRLVSTGEVVKAGEAIGLSGSSGGAQIPCLHFQIRIGENKEENSVEPL
jgi:murein DD-endopeptidase MepM/ murein hydrolase activator NlpD